MNKTVKKYLLIFLGVIGGYAVSLVLSPTTTAIIHKLWPTAASQNPPAVYLFVDLLYSTLYLMVGAYVAAWIAKSISSSIILGIIFCGLSIATLVAEMDTIQPRWYYWFFIIVSIPATYFGGYLRIHKTPFREKVAPA